MSIMMTRMLQGSLKPYLILWQSELEFMADLAFRTGCIETGGEVYGLQTHGGRLVIMYATAPGPKAIHKAACFQQDIEFFRENNSLLLNQYAIQYIGNWHSHHTLPVKGPSGGDIRSLNSLASKNDYRRLCQFVLTFETDPATSTYCLDNRDHLEKKVSESAEDMGKSKGFSVKRGVPDSSHFTSLNKDPTFIGVHSFFYQNAGYTLPFRCPIKVISGMSPIRFALNDRHSTYDLRGTPSFPIERILYESVDADSHIRKTNPDLPSRLQSQFVRLPLWLRNEATIQYGKEFILFYLPTQQDQGQVIVAYGQEHPHRLAAVFYRQSMKCGKLIDLSGTALCHGEFTKLSIAYKKAILSLGMGHHLNMNDRSANDQEHHWHSVYEHPPKQKIVKQQISPFMEV